MRAHQVSAYFAKVLKRQLVIVVHVLGISLFIPLEFLKYDLQERSEECALLVV